MEAAAEAPAAAAAAEPPDGGLVSVAEFRQHYAGLRAKTRRQAAAQPARAGGSPEQRPKDVGTPAETRGPGGAARTPRLRARPALPPVPNRSVSTCSLDELREVSAVWSAHAQQAVQESTLSPASTTSQRSPLSLPPEGSPPRPRRGPLQPDDRTV